MYFSLKGNKENIPKCGGENAYTPGQKASVPWRIRCVCELRYGIDLKIKERERQLYTLPNK